MVAGHLERVAASPARPGCQDAPVRRLHLFEPFPSFQPCSEFWHPFLMGPSAGGFESPVSSHCCDFLSSMLCPSGHPSQTENFWKAGPVPCQTLNPHSPCFLGGR